MPIKSRRLWINALVVQPLKWFHVMPTHDLFEKNRYQEHSMELIDNLITTLFYKRAVFTKSNEVFYT